MHYIHFTDLSMILQGIYFLVYIHPFIVFHMWNTVLYCIVLYCIVLYCTVLFKYVIFHILNIVLVSTNPSCLSPNVNKSVHMYCAVQYSTCTVQCSAVTELVVDGYVTPESDEKCEDVKKLQKEAEVKEEMRYEILFCYFPRWKIILPQG